MSREITFNFKKLSHQRPEKSGQILAFHPCEGFQVIEWDGEDFTLWNGEIYPEHMIHMWHELPDETILDASLKTQKVNVSVI